MSLLVTVLRGLRSRLVLSAGSLVLIALAVGATVLGPMFQQASVESYTLGRLDRAPATQTALSWSLSRSDPQVTLDELVASGTHQLQVERPEQYGAPEITYFSALPSEPGRSPAASFIAREGACEILEVTGRCPAAAGEVLVNEVDLAPRSLGDTIRVARLGQQVIVGSYATPITSENWLLPAVLSSLPASRLSDASPGPYLVSVDAFARLPVAEQLVVLDSRLRVPDNLDDETLDALVRRADELGESRYRLGEKRAEGIMEGLSALNSLDSVLEDVRSQRAAAADAVTPAVVSLILVALAMILRLLSASAELRVPELTLAGLRGAGRRRTWLLGLAEPAALLGAGTALGLGVGFLATRELVARWLRPGLAVELPTLSLTAAALVVVVIAATAVLVVAESLRETLGERLSGVRRPRAGSRVSVTVELVLVTAAVALPLAQIGRGSGGELDASALLLPVVLAVAAGLLVTRAATLLSGACARRRTGGNMSWFLAVRALSRRGQGTLVMLPVTSAIAVAVFSLGVSGAATDWRDSVTATRTPAPFVYSSPLPLDDTLALTRRLDPEGRWLMAAARTSVASGPLVLFDTARFAEVATWSDQWLPGADAQEVEDLLTLSSPPVVLTGEQVGITVTNDSVEATPLTVQLDVYAPGAGLDRIYLGPFGPGTSTSSAPAPTCADGCDLRAISVGGGAIASSLSLHGAVVLDSLTVGSQGVPDALSPDGWDPTSAASLGVSQSDGLVLDVDTGDDIDIVTITSRSLTAPIPVLVGDDAAGTVSLQDGQSVLAELQSSTPVDVVGAPSSTPFLGPRGTVVDLVAADALLSLTGDLTTSYVLLAAGTPDAIIEGLGASGLTIDGTAEETRSELDQGAYAQALRLYQAVAAVILVMALGGLLVSLSVQLPARRRDAASLRVVGVPRRTIWLATGWESLVTLGGAALAGLAAGVLAQVVLLRDLTLGVIEDRATPPVVAGLDVTRVGVLAAVIALVLLVVALATSIVVVRGAGGATLRESAR
ncbi:FtsX-like permease family protein [Nocardioides sp.]|jgi:putative ABC transport system permease protein|uniref:FtsX-like permease family protein n=1 Tax=Nocardioides sp. TaxID=35761 RepID=UPI0026250638|nr:FtsX-like permease family protein [Nocardioides sp.]